MQLLLSDGIDRAKFYLDDDHNETKGWISEARFIDLFATEYRQLYRRWVRQSLVATKPTDTTFTGPSTTLTNVLAVVGVAEDLGSGQYRVLENEQAAVGRHPFRNEVSGPGVFWEVSGSADNLLVEISPEDTGSYVARWIAGPTAPTATTDTLSVPDGGDERLILGVVRRALIKESARSMAVEARIAEADAELAFLGAGRLNSLGPSARRTRRDGFRSLFPTEPSLFRFV